MHIFARRKHPLIESSLRLQTNMVMISTSLESSGAIRRCRDPLPLCEDRLLISPTDWVRERIDSEFFQQTLPDLLNYGVVIRGELQERDANAKRCLFTNNM